MQHADIARVRRFNRAVTTEIGALDESFLGRGRPLGEARVLCRIGDEGCDVAAIRSDLGLDSGLTSRLLRSLEAQGLITVTRASNDARRRIARPTAKGRAEIVVYNAISDDRAGQVLMRQSRRDRGSFLAAMDRIACVLNRDRIEVADADPECADARACLLSYYSDLDEAFEEGFEVETSLDPDPTALRPPVGAFLLARSDGLAIGCCALKGQGASVGEIKRMWVAPMARGLGVARQLLEAAEDRARTLGLTRLRLDTNRALKAAIALYRQTGWREVDPFNDERYAHHWFEKTLDT